MTKKPSSSRQRVKKLQVPVLPSENDTIQANAASCGLSIAAYLRNLGTGYEPKGILDYKAALELSKINADQGRLGGLLKMWLTNDNRMKVLGKEQTKSAIQSLLNDIKAAQTLLIETAKKV